MLNLHLRNIDSWWPVSIYQVGVTSACYVYQKIVILMITHTNFWWFRTQILKCLVIPHTNIAYTYDDFPWPILHRYNLLIILFRSLGPFLFKRKLSVLLSFLCVPVLSLNGILLVCHLWRISEQWINSPCQ